MRVTVLMSTVNKENIDELELKKKNIKECIIVNQSNKEKNIEKKEKYSMITYCEKGLSKSRNRLIENAKDNTDIAIITDDDVSFVEDYDMIVKNAYKKFDKADVIIFKSLDENGNSRKKYFNKNKRLKKFDLLSICSIEITFKTKSIIDKVKFDEKFGLGASYKSGEENIFLEECRKKGLKIYFYDEFINIHASESTGTSTWSEKDIYDKGVLCKRLYPVLGYFIPMPICLLKKENLEIGFFKSIKTMYKGMYEYTKVVNKK